MFRRNFLQFGTLGSCLLSLDNWIETPGTLLKKLLPPGREPDWAALRSELLLDPKLTYLNSASIGCTPKSLLAHVHEAGMELERNPFENVWRDGMVREVETVRQQVAAHWGAMPEEIAFSENTTSGLAAVMSGIEWNAGDEVLLTNHEHLSCLAIMKYFAKRLKLQLKFVDISGGAFSPNELLERIDSQITPRTRLWCCSHVDSFSGIRMPIAAIAKRMRERGVLSLCDGAQSLGMIDFRIPDLGVDAFAGSGHKWLFGPKGMGLLYLSSAAQTSIRPLSTDWSFAALTPCTGTRNCAALIGWKWVLELQKGLGSSKIESRVKQLAQTVFDEVTRQTGLQPLTLTARDQIESGIVAFRLGDATVNWDVARRLANEFRIEIKPLPPTCELDEPDSPHRRDYNAIRISPHVFNTDQEISTLVDALIQILKK